MQKKIAIMRTLVIVSGCLLAIIIMSSYFLIQNHYSEKKKNEILDHYSGKILGIDQIEKLESDDPLVTTLEAMGEREENYTYYKATLVIKNEEAKMIEYVKLAGRGRNLDVGVETTMDGSFERHDYAAQVSVYPMDYYLDSSVEVEENQNVIPSGETAKADFLIGVDNDVPTKYVDIGPFDYSVYHVSEENFATFEPW